MNNKVRVISIGDAGEYGIEFGGWYAWALIKLINKQIMSESKTTIKTVSNDADFNRHLLRLERETENAPALWCLDHRAYEDYHSSCKSAREYEGK